MNNHPLLNGLP